MLRFFKRRRPAPAHRATPVLPSREDVDIAHWHGLTAQYWMNLPAIVQVDLREEFYAGQGLAS